ncbi:FTR1 family protein [Candidatus Bathyarchaeota archaeon]|nr:FTR1 family protein [Candidatus Bathyarchaeota archaeon]
MLGQYLITFREAFEAALISAIIFSYFIRTGRRELMRFVWYGIYMATVVSIGLGTFIWLAYGILQRAFKLIFEAAASLVASVVLSTMIYWMAFKGKYIKKEMERRIEAITKKGTSIGLMSLTFIFVFREGLETVLFLTPFLQNDVEVTIIGVAIGIISAIILCYGIFLASMKINLRKFFYFTSLLLIFIAGGFVGYGIHELIEYFELIGANIGWLAEPAYDLNIPEENIMHHKNIIGSVLAVMFGYTVSAERARIIVHLLYLLIAFPSVILVYSSDDDGS